MTEKTNFDSLADFDLPEVESNAVKPTIHKAGEDSVCVSCEG
jgi:hypothetical protein